MPDWGNERLVYLLTEMTQHARIEQLLALTKELHAENKRLRVENVDLQARLRAEVIQSAKDFLVRDAAREKKSRREAG